MCRGCKILDGNMIGRRTVLAVIAARGGSKGLPGKNVADLGGRPVIAWSVAAGQTSRYIDRLILSSDDPEIIAAARNVGCEVPFRRPARFATDRADIYGVLFHALDFCDQSFDYVVLLQASSPLRTTADIDACIELCYKSEAPAVVSMCIATKPPHWMYTLNRKNQLCPIFKSARKSERRQALPAAYLPNGAVYVARTKWLRKHRNFVSAGTRAYVMPAERSIDIDTPLDLLLARAIIGKPSKMRRKKQ